MKSEEGENVLFSLVESGILKIDNSGFVFKNGKRQEHLLQNGYYETRVMINKKRYQTVSHRLVYRWFYGDIPDGLVINHIDGNKGNNSPENLEVCTYTENMKHAFELGLMDEFRNRQRKLSNIQINEIIDLYNTGNYFQREIAKMFGVSHQTISRVIKSERRYKQEGEISSIDHRLRSQRISKVYGRFI
jgi:DNA-binding XRE family transcriptional regulator